MIMSCYDVVALKVIVVEVKVTMAKKKKVIIMMIQERESSLVYVFFYKKSYKKMDELGFSCRHAVV